MAGIFLNPGYLPFYQQMPCVSAINFNPGKVSPNDYADSSCNGRWAIVTVVIAQHI